MVRHASRFSQQVDGPMGYPARIDLKDIVLILVIKCRISPERRGIRSGFFVPKTKKTGAVWERLR